MFIEVQVNEPSFDSVNLIPIRGQPREQSVNAMAPGSKSTERLHQHREYTRESRLQFGEWHENETDTDYLVRLHRINYKSKTIAM